VKLIICDFNDDNNVDPRYVKDAVREFEKTKDHNKPFIIGVFGNSKRLNHKFNVVFNKKHSEFNQELEHSLNYKYRYLVLTSVDEALSTKEFLELPEDKRDNPKVKIMRMIAIETTDPTRPIILFTNDKYDDVYNLINSLTNFFSNPEAGSLLKTDIFNLFVKKHPGNYLFFYRNMPFYSSSETVKAKKIKPYLKIVSF